MSIIEDVQCPNCGWQPDGEKHWLCRSCEMEFDMFADAGRCPRCNHSHEYTECIEYAGGCQSISPHLDWYKGLDQGLREINIEKTGY
jgi:DNA-directed RNA polymerase subunit RPC12/RpoP